MNKQRPRSQVSMVLAVAALASACDANHLHTGTVTPPKPVVPPAPIPVQPDGTCAAGLTACGGSASGYCFNLAASPEHCGTCDTACPLGVPCDQGTCRVVHCTPQITVKTMRVDYSFGNRYQLALADFDGDGAVDMVAPTPTDVMLRDGWSPGGPTSATFFRGQGDGAFVAGERYPAQTIPKQWFEAFAAFAADLNHDQMPDLVLRSQSSIPAARLGRGDGTFGPEITLTGGAPAAFITVADLDGDRIPDLAAVSGGDAVVNVYRGKGDGSFTDRQDLALGGTPSAVFATDWNRDGIVDLVAIEDYLHIFLGTGDGRFAAAIDCGLFLAAPTGEPVSVVLADFDGDGRVDMVANNTLFLGMRECNFERQTTFHVPYVSAYPMVAGDFNGDGATDLAVASLAGIGFLPGDGHGNLGALVKLGDLGIEQGQPNQTTGYAVDVNGDGRLDLLVANQYSLRVFLNTCK